MQVKYRDLKIDNRIHRYFNLGDETDQARIHFSGANGFPVGSYADFLARFSNHHSVTAVDCRATIEDIPPPKRNVDLHDFADDLIMMTEALHDKAVIAMGHSFGAHVSLLAAIKRPDLFSKLVLIEPASLPSATLDRIYKHLPRFLIDSMLPMIPRTRARQRVWPLRSAFIERYRHHKTFQYMTESAFKAYAEHGLRPVDNDQYELVFAPEWEAHIFSKVEFVWKNLRLVKVPTLFIRAEHSSLYSHELFQQENWNLPAHVATTEIDDTHHLLPLEHPEACEQAIQQWLAT